MTSGGFAEASQMLASQFTKNTGMAAEIALGSSMGA